MTNNTYITIKKSHLKVTSKTVLIAFFFLLTIISCGKEEDSVEVEISKVKRIKGTNNSGFDYAPPTAYSEPYGLKYESNGYLSEYGGERFNYSNGKIINARTSPASPILNFTYEGDYIIEKKYLGSKEEIEISGIIYTNSLYEYDTDDRISKVITTSPEGNKYTTYYTYSEGIIKEKKEGEDFYIEYTYDVGKKNYSHLLFPKALVDLNINMNYCISSEKKITSFFETLDGVHIHSYCRNFAHFELEPIPKPY